MNKKLGLLSLARSPADTELIEVKGSLSAIELHEIAQSHHASLSMQFPSDTTPKNKALEPLK
jgi:hypothetical protein